MRGIMAGVFLVAAACGGGDPGGPTTSHALAGEWIYETWSLQDGFGATCSTEDSQLTLVQHGVTFDGQVLFGTISCTWPNGSSSASLGSSQVRTGTIRGDSVSYDFDRGAWRSIGIIVTPDSMAGIVNAIYTISGGGSLILTGFWSATRAP